MLRKLLVIGMVLASVGFAQRGRGGGGGGGDAPPMMGGGPGTKIDMISNTLSLTKDQKKAAKTMLDDAAKEATPLREQLSKARIAIADAVQAKKSEADVNQAVNAYAALATQMTSIEVKTFTKIHDLLDVTQKANNNGVNMVFGMMKNLFATKNWNEE